MKILQINKYHYIKGGSETVFFNTIKLLENNSQEVSRFCLNNSKNYPSNEEEYFVNYPEMSTVNFLQKLKNFFSFFYNRDAKRNIEQLIKNKKPDIAHIHLLFNGISVSILPVLKKYNIPIVMSVHDYRLICPSYLFMDGNNRICERCNKGNYFNCIKYRCYNNNRFISIMLALDMYFRNLFFPIEKYVDNFIFVSNFTSSKHSSYNPVYEKKGIVLHNFVNIDNLLSIQERQPSNPKFFLYYGRLSKEKGILTLIRTFQKLNLNLKIVGQGPLLEYKDKIKASNIEFLGFKSGIELYQLVKDAYFSIAPSECYETFGLTIAESMLCGTPVIGAEIGAIPELINDSESGFLFKSGDMEDLSEVVMKAYTYPNEKYKKMRETALEKSQKYSDSSSYYNNLMKIYKQTIKINEKK